MISKAIAWILNILDVVLIVIFAFIFSQGPQFIQQYTQRLGGHVEEARQQVEMMRSVARLSDKTIDQYILKFQQSTDPIFVQQGLLMEKILKRATDIAKTENELQNASSLNRVWIFLSTIQLDVAKGTLKDFQPGLSLTWEGLLYVLFGAIFGKFLSYLVKCCIQPLRTNKLKPTQTS